MLNQKALSKVAKPNSRVVGGPAVKYWKDRLEQVWFKILAATVYRRVLLLERTLDRRDADDLASGGRDDRQFG
jgi:hypothetical protein